MKFKEGVKLGSSSQVRVKLPLSPHDVTAGDGDVVTIENVVALLAVSAATSEGVNPLNKEESGVEGAVELGTSLAVLSFGIKVLVEMARISEAAMKLSGLPAPTVTGTDVTKGVLEGVGVLAVMANKEDSAMKLSGRDPEAPRGTPVDKAPEVIPFVDLAAADTAVELVNCATAGVEVGTSPSVQRVDELDEDVELDKYVELDEYAELDEYVWRGRSLCP